MDQNTISVIGGDFRTIITIRRLVQAGYTVHAYGFDENILLPDSVRRTPTLSEAVKEADAVLLPLPSFSEDDCLIRSALFSESIPCDALFSCMPSRALLLCAMPSRALCEDLKKRHIAYADYAAREEFAVQNAVPTAEGAIEIALRELPQTLQDSECLVMGFGRIGKVLADFLSGFHSSVTVAARKKETLAQIRSRGHHAVRASEIEAILPRADVIFNTVPQLIFPHSALCRMKKDVLLIDLASMPGGVDFAAAKSMGLHAIHALALPGKCAPISAGNIMFDTIQNLLEEWEENEWN